MNAPDRPNASALDNPQLAAEHQNDELNRRKGEAENNVRFTVPTSGRQARRLGSGAQIMCHGVLTV